MLLLKACPRCRGDLVVDRDPHGRFTKCLQCGFAKDIETPTARTPRQDADQSKTDPSAPVKAARKRARTA